MTTEEAIKILKNINVLNLEEYTEDEINQAIEVVLKELDKKDKVIDEMAKSIYKDRYLKDLSDEQYLKNIRYFYFKKIENDERRN